jgi:predicted Rossmann fold nucleotide-binding protein DprA/Smf involved in DNA uptake
MNPDTAATLLLCSRLGRLKEPVPVLEAREYHRLVGWLSTQGLSPRDLLEGALPPEAPSGAPVTAERLTPLLDRGGVMALAVESWESRGVWVISQYDEAYPARLKALNAAAPPLLYGAGDLVLFAGPGPALAIVGSRDVDERGAEFTAELARACARQGVRVVSGAARGVDRIAMGAALEAGGAVVGIMADSLLRTVSSGGNQGPLMDGQLLLASPYDPAAGFNVGNAMGRNKHIYALASAAAVVQASEGSGGTWNGAIEALKRGTPPVFTRVDEGVPAGNIKLLELGAHAFPDEALEDLPGWLDMPTNGHEQLVQAQLL